MEAGEPLDGWTEEMGSMDEKSAFLMEGERAKEEIAWSHSFLCSFGGNAGKVYVYPDRFRFATSEEEVPLICLEASWSVLEMVAHPGSDTLVLEVSHEVRWHFEDIDGQSNICSVIEGFTGHHRRSFQTTLNLPVLSEGTADKSPLIRELFLFDTHEEAELPPAATQIMSEEFPLSLKMFLGLMFGEEYRFFQNLHSRRDSRIEYGPWVLGENAFHRQVTFNTIQAPLSVEVTQSQRLYRSANRFCLDFENNFKGFPGSGRLTVHIFCRLVAPEAMGEEESGISLAEIFMHVEVGTLFIGKGHAVREAMEDVHEYCSRFKYQVQAAILAGVDETGMGTLRRLEETKPELERLQEFALKSATNQTQLATAKIALLAIIIVQIVTLVRILF